MYSSLFSKKQQVFKLDRMSFLVPDMTIDKENNRETNFIGNVPNFWMRQNTIDMIYL